MKKKFSSFVSKKLAQKLRQSRSLPAKNRKKKSDSDADSGALPSSDAAANREFDRVYIDISNYFINKLPRDHSSDEISIAGIDACSVEKHVRTRALIADNDGRKLSLMAVMPIFPAFFFRRSFEA